MFNKTKKISAGFSIIELLIVIAISIIISGIVFNKLSNTSTGQTFENSLDQVISLVNDARTRTIEGINASQYGVHFDSTHAVLFTGASYSSTSTSNNSFVLSGDTVLSSFSLGTSGGANVVFNRQDGTTTQSGSFTISSTSSSRSKTIKISSMGMVTSN